MQGLTKDRREGEREIVFGGWLLEEIQWRRE
jgi:hypothetical protein